MDVEGTAMSLTMDDRDGFIWLDGKLVPWRESRMHVLTHALHYGSAVFEGERIYDGRVFRLGRPQHPPDRLRPPARLRDPLDPPADRGGDARCGKGPTPCRRATCGRSPGAAAEVLGVSGIGTLGASGHRAVGPGRPAVGGGARVRHQRHHGQVPPPVGRFRARPCQGGRPLHHLRHREGPRAQGGFTTR